MLRSGVRPSSRDALFSCLYRYRACFLVMPWCFRFFALLDRSSKALVREEEKRRTDWPTGTLARCTSSCVGSFYTTQFASPSFYLVHEAERYCAQVKNASVCARIWWSLSGSFAVSLRFPVVLLAVCRENHITEKRKVELFIVIRYFSSVFILACSIDFTSFGFGAGVANLAFWHVAEPREVAFVNH